MAILIQHEGEDGRKTIGVITHVSNPANVKKKVEKAIRDDVDSNWVCPPSGPYKLRREKLSKTETAIYIVHEEASDNDGAFIVSDVPVL